MYCDITCYVEKHRRMDKYTILKRKTNSINYFPFLLAAGVALDALELGASFCKL